MRPDANAKAYEALGRHLLIRRGDPRGIALVERALAMDPSWVKPRATLAAHFLTVDPARSAAILGTVNSPYAHELRAMLHDAAGREAEALLALDEALARFVSLMDARVKLCEWHFEERRFTRSRFHAAALLDLHRTNLEGQYLVRIDRAIVWAYRMGGGFHELVPWLRERCRDGIPDHLASHIFLGLASQAATPDFALALRAAERALSTAEHEDDIQCWRVMIAQLYATERGDLSHLEALARDGLADNAAGWGQLARAYGTVRNFDAATACADRALQIDPDSEETLTIHAAIAISIGDGGLLHRLARALTDARPTDHDGYEVLARSHARRDEPSEALENGRRAIEIDPLCNNAWLALSEALVIAGDLAAAAEAAERSHAIEAAGRGDDLTILRAALARDPGALETALGLRYRHLPALPFPTFVEKLRAAARSMP
jgi:tetratricopeptide (TPR) repeat protein